MATLAQVLEEIKAGTPSRRSATRWRGHERKAIWERPMDAMQTELSEQQKVMVRQQIYFPRYAGEPPVRRDRCRHAVTQLRQCDRNPTTTRDGWAVCPRHATTGEFPAHSALGR